MKPRPFLEQVCLPAVFLLADGTSVMVLDASTIDRVPVDRAYVERPDLALHVYLELPAKDTVQ